jgi:hypothetical protein
MEKALRIHVWTVLASILWLALTGQAQATNYTMTLYSQGSGTIAENPTNTSYPSGVTVTLTAAPSTGWFFANWSGNASGTNNPLNVTMNSNLVITGAFLAYPTYTLSLVTNGQGTIVLNPPGGSYYSNTTVTVTATPASGWLFNGWSGASTSTNNPLNFTLDANSTLAGNFVQLPAFDLEPVDVTNAVGSTVTLSSHSVGTAPVYYQWFFNNGPLNGATTPSLTITNAPLTDAGNYWVVATNAYGSITSSVVVLALTNTFGSTNVVSSPTDASLRSAIAAGGWVIIACNGTFNLTNTINITQNTTLDGTGVSAIISGSNTFRIFNVAPNVSFSITNLTLANGTCSNKTNAYGAAVNNNSGILNLISCTLTNNNAEVSTTLNGIAEGGAIFNNGGIVLLNQSILTHNSVVVNGEGGFGSYNAAYGGAVYNTNGLLTIVNCLVQSNLCQTLEPPSGGTPGNTLGGAIYDASGSLFITNSTFAYNLVSSAPNSGGSETAEPAYGGALAAIAGTVTIDHSQFINNISQGGDGSDATAGPAFGGAIFSHTYITVGWSTFSGNQALAGNDSYNFGNNGTPGASGNGGALYNIGGAELNDCAFYSNRAQGGSVSVYPDSTATGGSAQGGAICSDSELLLTNCTVALNLAAAGGGSVDSPYPSGSNGVAIGGGIYNINSQCVVMNSTIATNSCSTTGGGLPGYAAGSDIANTNGTVLLQNSLLAYGGTNGNSYGPITDQGYNISSDGTANLFGGASYNFTDPQLAPLANNGGPTLTMALLPTSPAIGLGTYIGAPATDQRGYPRPTTSAVDSGAYQYISPPPAPFLQIGSITNNIVISFTATTTNVYTLQSSADLKTWVNIGTNGPFSYATNFSLPHSKQGPAQFFRLWMQ